MSLRSYQREAVDAVWEHLRTRDDNPCIVLPTAAGKSHVLAEICREAVSSWSGRVLVLTHCRELVEQNAAKIIRLLGRDMVGIYSAGLKSRDIRQPVIAAGIQSVYRRAFELGAFNLCVVDEAHLLPPDGEGIYRTFLTAAKTINPQLRVIGLTATPFRCHSGEICAPENILNHVCYEIGVRELIAQKYLSPLISKAGMLRADTSELHIRGGEFIADEAEALMDTDALVRSAVREIIELTAERNACLIFATSIGHGEHIVRVFQEDHGLECGFITGSTPTRERDWLIARFRGEWPEDHEEKQTELFGSAKPNPQDSPLKYLCNVNVLTTGFDCPRTDCIAMLRPTMSPGLMYQMIGRGFRLHSSKQNCLVLDYADNILRHGPVDQISVGHRPKKSGGGEQVAKVCPNCQSIILAGYSVCPECQFVFPKPEAKHAAKASEVPVLSGEVTIKDYEVLEVDYSVHRKHGASANHPKTMRVEYRVNERERISEYVCPEHTGYALGKFQSWWRKRCDMPFPRTSSEAVAIARAGGLAETTRIRVRSISGDEFDRIIHHELGPVPLPVEYETDAERAARMRREDGWEDDSDAVFAARDADGDEDALIGAASVSADEIPF